MPFTGFNNPMNNESSVLKIDNSTTNGVVFGGSTSSNVGSTAAGTDGQVIIAATGSAPAFASITSSSGTITFTPGPNTLDMNASSSVAITYQEDAGSASPIANVLQVLGGHDVNTSGAGNAVTVNLDNAITLGDLSTIAVGSDALTITSGNVTISGTGVGAGGNLNMPFYIDNTAGAGRITVGGTNLVCASVGGATFVGYAAGNTTYTNPENTAVGTAALTNLTTGRFNVALGNHSGTALTIGVNNTFVGDEVAPLLTSGSGNTIVGYAIGGGATFNGSNNVVVNAGQLGQITYLGTESNNILIENVGVLGESNVMRIGTSGSGTGQVNKAFVAGTYGVTPAGATQVMVMDSSGQMGTSATPPTPASSCNFVAYRSSAVTNVTGDGTSYDVIFDSTVSNVGSAYSTGTGVFTAPATGIYSFSTTVTSNNYTAAFSSLQCLFQGSVNQYSFDISNPGIIFNVSGNVTSTGSIVIPMTAGDTMKIRLNVSGSTKTIGVYGQALTGVYTYFQGVRIS